MRQRLRQPLRFQDNIYETTANSFYRIHRAGAGGSHRFSQRHYTFSKAIDEVTDFNSDFSAQNPLNLNWSGRSRPSTSATVIASGVIKARLKTRLPETGCCRRSSWRRADDRSTCCSASTPTTTATRRATVRDRPGETPGVAKPSTATCAWPAASS